MIVEHRPVFAAVGCLKPEGKLVRQRIRIAVLFTCEFTLEAGICLFGASKFVGIAHVRDEADLRGFEHQVVDVFRRDLHQRHELLRIEEVVALLANIREGFPFAL